MKRIDDGGGWANIEEDKVEIVEKQHDNSSKRVVGRPFPKGVSGNPGGRPKGTSMKAFARAWLMAMTPEEKLKFLNSLDPSIVWRMSEGNPANEVNVDGEIRLPLYLPSALLEKYGLTPGTIEDSGEHKQIQGS